MLSSSAHALFVSPVCACFLCCSFSKLCLQLAIWLKIVKKNSRTNDSFLNFDHILYFPNILPSVSLITRRVRYYYCNVMFFNTVLIFTTLLIFFKYLFISFSMSHFVLHHPMPLDGSVMDHCSTLIWLIHEELMQCF